ncbi:hypothetical protein PMG71_10350 [Roseofilum sp. BLCC_M154]|uniref:Restriction endonuclease type IV Mrr domain-containing protein n=1 Tax=Roseofilum acuticapitatum BLCC-M154 TaxID=3022444 RepID=A0ABT7ASE9_9CYAN|nr:hypothetical protein [Roseofilum acuticapitatum]MDJ1169826.1 hypothetical protein [Roseofilum acuticapitatum BLCC-M154]
MVGRQGPINKEKGSFFELLVENLLWQADVDISDRSERRYTDDFHKDTEIDRIISDRGGSEFAILEIKSGQFNDAEQARRLVSLAKQERLKLIFATPDGTTSKFSKSVLAELNKSQIFIINPNEINEVHKVISQGINYGLPTGLLDPDNSYCKNTNSKSSKVKWTKQTQREQVQNKKNDPQSIKWGKQNEIANSKSIISENSAVTKKKRVTRKMTR